MARVRGTLPLAASLLIAAGAVALLAFSNTLNPLDAIMGRGAIVTVPDVEGRALPRAEAEVDEVGLRSEIVPAFSLSVPQGSVIRQDPPAGRKVREGETVELVVSRGANRVEMPDAVGRPLDEVRPPLEDAGVPLDVVPVADEKVPEGVVITQEPDPGVMVTGEDVARFEVSAGPADRSVPEVVGLSIEAAGFRLGDAGLAVGEVTFVDDPAVPIGAVAGTDPAVGTTLERDAVVALRISGGPPAVALPKVTDLTRATAIERLESLGFVVSTAGRLVAEGGPGIGAVFEQHPDAGTQLRPGQVVTIVVGRVPPEPPPTTTTTAPPPPTPPAPTPPAPTPPAPTPPGPGGDGGP